MVDLLVSPLSFAPTKVGYKQYLKAGGAMLFPFVSCFYKIPLNTYWFKSISSLPKKYL